jgi:hypothetical protein
MTLGRSILRKAIYNLENPDEATRYNTPLALWRIRHNFSITEATRRIGCSRNAWQRWERGEHHPPLYILLACIAIEREIEGEHND